MTEQDDQFSTISGAAIRKAKGKATAVKPKTISNAELGQLATARATRKAHKPSKGKGTANDTEGPPRFATPDFAAEQSKTIFDLPAELRTDIWDMVIVQEPLIKVSPIRPFVKEPALLAVNRQIRSEAMSIWYADNDFEVMGSSPAIKFLRSRNDEQVRSMRSLCITTEKSDLMGSQPRAWVEYLRKKVETVMRESEPRGLRRKALKFQVVVGGEMRWMDGDELQDYDVDGPADKGKKIRAGPRKGEKVPGASSKVKKESGDGSKRRPLELD